MKTTIRGSFGNQQINITLESPLDGKEVAHFVAQFYAELASETPGILQALERHMPSIVAALRKLHDVAEQITQSLVKG